MKLKIILLSLTISLAFSACKKCETCVPYHYNMGTLGAVDKNAQAMKLCDQTDITAYESLTSFEDAYRDTVKFVCN